MRTCQWLQLLLLLTQSVKYEINEEFWMFWWALYCDTSAYIEFHFRKIWIIFLGTWMSSSSMLSLHILSLLYIHHKQTWYTRAYYSILLLLLYEVNINSFFMFSFLQRCKNEETNETFSETKILYWGRSWFHFLSIKFFFASIVFLIFHFFTII